MNETVETCYIGKDREINPLYREDLFLADLSLDNLGGRKGYLHRCLARRSKNNVNCFSTGLEMIHCGREAAPTLFKGMPIDKEEEYLE